MTTATKTRQQLLRRRRVSGAAPPADDDVISAGARVVVGVLLALNLIIVVNADSGYAVDASSSPLSLLSTMTTFAKSQAFESASTPTKDVNVVVPQPPRLRRLSAAAATTRDGFEAMATTTTETTILDRLETKTEESNNSAARIIGSTIVLPTVIDNDKLDDDEENRYIDVPSDDEGYHKESSHYLDSLISDYSRASESFDSPYSHKEKDNDKDHYQAQYVDEGEEAEEMAVSFLGAKVDASSCIPHSSSVFFLLVTFCMQPLCLGMQYICIWNTSYARRLSMEDTALYIFKCQAMVSILATIVSSMIWCNCSIHCTILFANFVWTCSLLFTLCWMSLAGHLKRTMEVINAPTSSERTIAAPTRTPIQSPTHESRRPLPLGAESNANADSRFVTFRAFYRMPAAALTGPTRPSSRLMPSSSSSSSSSSPSSSRRTRQPRPPPPSPSSARPARRRVTQSRARFRTSTGTIIGRRDQPNPSRKERQLAEFRRRGALARAALSCSAIVTKDDLVERVPISPPSCDGCDAPPPSLSPSSPSSTLDRYDDAENLVLRIPSLRTTNSMSCQYRTVPNACAICLCSYELNSNVTWSSHPSGQCPHVFHSNCILTWLTRSGKPLCPCCRQDFVDV